MRASRERRGVTLAQIAAETKLGVELWADLEDNNLSRWPRQIYARSYVRDYALRVGLDADEVVDDFCRLFPEWGDRRAEALIRGQAAIVNHNLDWEDLPAKEQRRAGDQRPTPLTIIGRHRARIIAACFDLTVTLLYGYSGVLLGFGLWRSLTVAAVSYNVIATLFSSRGFGLRVADSLIRVVSAMPAARRLLISSRVGDASSPQDFPKTTIRLVLVPLALFFTPQQLAVFVNACELMTIISGSRPAATPQGSTASSSLIFPPRTSPTSNATWPPRFSTRASSRKTSVIAACQSSTFRWMEIWTPATSMPQNQQRSQLSAA